MPRPLIRCANDGLAPWSIVCVHLLNGLSHEWLPVPVDDGSDV
jgi:hypothetical protein